MSEIGRSESRNSSFEVLIVENDPAAARLTQEAFREVGLTETVRCIRDGDEALAYLRGEGRREAQRLPDVIFLDLHLPKKSGLQVLSEIKSSERLKATPVVVISGSDNPREVREAYELHASCYIRKPNDLHAFLKFIAVRYEFWGSVVTLPEKGELTGARS